ncbi:MAG: molybdate ABC transporter substrate-binding protein [Proteobacteria bacterium]|nr:molybdate ABC transporter substrate-binding protein [Pseudomonadota bacterium]
MKRFMQRSMLGLMALITMPYVAFATDPTVHLAVSTSIYGPLESICQKFGQSTRFKCKITTAPTGHLYAHIMHGMAYDLFVSSDETYTQGLLNAQKADSDSRFVIATGRVVLWSAAPFATAESLHSALLNDSNTTFVIANPGVSSYGGAAKEVLQYYNLWGPIQGRLVYGKSIKHSYDLIMSNRVPMGFVSLAQLSTQTRLKKRYWEPDPKSYKPVLHEVVALKPLKHKQASKEFIAYMRNETSCQIFQDAGFSCNHLSAG